MRKYKRKKGKAISKANKYTYRGTEYKSGLELYAAQKFEEAQLFVQYEPVKFILQDSFYMIDELYERQSNGKGDFKKRGGKKVLPLTYRPDFIGGNFICETKGFAGEAFPLRWKLFKKMICDNYDGEIMIFKPQNRKEVDKMIEIILSKEVWKEITGYRGMYKISNYGRVKSYQKNRKNGNIKKLTKDKDGYLTTTLSMNKFIKAFKIHRLVAEHFIDNENLLTDVNHIDEIKNNNYVFNLQWLSHEDNMKYSKFVNSKKLEQYDLNDNLIHTYESLSSVIGKGFNKSSISQCCNGKIKISGGYKWKYK